MTPFQHIILALVILAVIMAYMAVEHYKPQVKKAISDTWGYLLQLPLITFCIVTYYGIYYPIHYTKISINWVCSLVGNIVDSYRDSKDITAAEEVQIMINHFNQPIID